MSSSALDKNPTVTRMQKLLSENALSSEDIISYFADIIEQSEDAIGAWEHYNKAGALQQAKLRDAARQEEETQGSLFGIPVGLKDIFDSKDFPTCYGSPIHSDRQPTTDCRVIEKLKQAGAVIMGKTVTTEFAFMHPSRTVNPHNHNYSPGGSSSGSAAAVAAGHLPLAVGTQTNGSVIRPASFCGVYGYKPTRGLVSRQGVLETSGTLDHVGLFARHLEDLVALTDAVAGHDSTDSASYEQPESHMLQQYQATQNSQNTKKTNVVWLDVPYSNRYSEDANAAFENLLSTLGSNIKRIEAPAEFEQYLDTHKAIYDYEIVRGLKQEINNHWSDISDTAQPILKKASERSEKQYRDAMQTRQSAIEWFDSFFKQYDAILTPSAVAEAPLMGSTGDPVCCTVWTLCGLPCITMPLLTGENGLPIGIQVVGARKSDNRLFQTARYIVNQVLK